MKKSIPILKILAQLALLALFFLSASLPARAASEISLLRMEKEDSLSRTKLTFYFSDLPQFSTEQSGQRVNLLLSDVRVSPKLVRLAEDETLVKLLLAQDYHDLLVSLLLRRPPVQMVSETLRDPARVVLELFWDGDSSARPGIVFRVGDLPQSKPGKVARAFSRKSPWDGRWLEFFREYHSEWRFELPQVYSSPNLPPLIADQQSPLWALQQLAQSQRWLSLLQDAAKLPPETAEQQEQLALLSVEAQIRSGALQAGLSRLQSLRNDVEGTSRARVEYLTAYAQAMDGQPRLALLTLQGLLPSLAAGDPWVLPTTLLAAEVALAARQDQLAQQYLQNSELVWPDALLAVRELRLADARAGLGEQGLAMESYRELVTEPGLFDFYLWSCNRAAFTAYGVQEYGLASRLYRRLTELMGECPGDDLLWFANGAATYEAGDLEWGLIALEKVTLERAGTEGGERAELRLIDHQLLKEGELGIAKAVLAYDKLAETSVSRMVREEASFKQALGQYLLGDHAESVNGLMQFRRAFANSKLLREADLLLLEQIPQVVKQLLEEKNALQAVIMVEQNRNLLLQGGFSSEFLQNLAAAFERLGLYARASRVLLYLFDQAVDDEQREPVYLPLANNFLKRGEYAMASDYASRYLETYPEGEERAALFRVLLDAFAEQDRQEELNVWLNRNDRPHSPALETRVAWIYWQQQKPAAVAASLELSQQLGGRLEVKEMALLAEAYFQLDRNSEAQQVYQRLLDDAEFGTQAGYRYAQLLLRGAQPEEALKLLQRLVDENETGPWSRLAQDLLIQMKPQQL